MSTTFSLLFTLPVTHESAQLRPAPSPTNTHTHNAAFKDRLAQSLALTETILLTRDMCQEEETVHTKGMQTYTQTNELFKTQSVG